MDVDLKNRGPDIKREMWKAVGRETHISSKCDEVRSGEVDAEVVVQLLFKHHLTVLWNKQTTPWTEWRMMPQVLTEQTYHRCHYKNIKSSWISNCGTPPLDINCGERHRLLATTLVNHSDVIAMCRTASWCVSTDLDVQDPDEVGSLRVVFDQTGHAAASLVPAGVPISCEHLDHCWRQRLERGKQGEPHLFFAASYIAMEMYLTGGLSQTKINKMHFKKNDQK